VQLGSGAFYTFDLLVAPATLVIAALLTVLAASATAWWRTMRADVGPLGASRERHEKKPRLLSLVPLLGGILLLRGGLALSLARPGGAAVTVGGHRIPYLPPIMIGGFTLTLVGILLAGPLLTAWLARAGSRGARGAATVIALGRIRRHPRATFRAVS